MISLQFYRFDLVILFCNIFSLHFDLSLLHSSSLSEHISVIFSFGSSTFLISFTSLSHQNSTLSTNLINEIEFSFNKNTLPKTYSKFYHENGDEKSNCHFMRFFRSCFSFFHFGSSLFATCLDLTFSFCCTSSFNFEFWLYSISSSLSFFCLIHWVSCLFAFFAHIHTQTRFCWFDISSFVCITHD